MGNVVAFNKQQDAQVEEVKTTVKDFVDEFMKNEFVPKATKVYIVVEDDEGEQISASLNYSDMELLWLSREIEYALNEYF
jgi:hypothetical protein